MFHSGTFPRASNARRLLAILALLLVASGARAAEQGRCDAPVGVDFSSAPLSSVGMAAEPLIRLNEYLDQAQHEIRALLILKDCRLVFERYRDGIGRGHNHTIYSVTKSVVSTLVGALMYQGKLAELDTPVSQLMERPGRLRDEAWANAGKVTLKNVMQMASGLQYTHNLAGGANLAEIYYTSTDRFGYALGQTIAAPPGTRFNYSDSDVSITGAVVAARAGDDLYSYAQQTLFDPLQMTNHGWLFRDYSGRYPGGWGLRLRPMDMLKVGQLYLQKGEWNGKRIFAESYPDLAWSPGVSKDYGLHWWIASTPVLKGMPVFYASGFKAQRIYVFPTLGMVVAVAASLSFPEEGKMLGEILGAVRASATEPGNPAEAQKDEAMLKQIQQNGFRGVTRTAQEMQDIPRR